MVRLGIVGIGTIATDYIELIAQGRICGLELAALCSRREQKVTELKEKFGLKARYFSDYAQMLASGCIDAVSYTHLICSRIYFRQNRGNVSWAYCRTCGYGTDF